jgi:hypothetical protein
MGVTLALVVDAQSSMRELGQRNSLCFQVLSCCRPTWPKAQARLASYRNRALYYVDLFVGTFGTNRTKPATATTNACPVWLNRPIVLYDAWLSLDVYPPDLRAEVRGCYRLLGGDPGRVSLAALGEDRRNKNTGNLRHFAGDFDKSETRWVA